MAQLFETLCMMLAFKESHSLAMHYCRLVWDVRSLRTVIMNLSENYPYKEVYEKLYRITVVNRCVVICAEEIPQKSVELIRCFEDTETNLSRGVVEPMMGLQRELNFKKNSASEFINASLNRQWFWNPNSGVNPRDMVSKPGGIIPTSKTKGIS